MAGSDRPLALLAIASAVGAVLAGALLWPEPPDHDGRTGMPLDPTVARPVPSGAAPPEVAPSEPVQTAPVTVSPVSSPAAPSPTIRPQPATSNPAPVLRSTPRSTPTPIVRPPISVSPTPRPAFPGQRGGDGSPRDGGLLPGMGLPGPL